VTPFVLQPFSANGGDLPGRDQARELARAELSRKAYADAAKGRFLVAGAHLPFPGIGHLRSEGKGYAWVPVDYTTAR